MSAAEKLRALDETFKASKNQREQADYLYRMAAVLPQILAVVEAAENVTFHGQPAHLYNEWHGSALIGALIALDEKLGDVT